MDQETSETTVATWLKPPESTRPIDAPNLPLRTRVRAGLSWNFSSALITEAIRFLRSIVLARLLAPEDFGLFAMSLTVVAALNAVSSLGLSKTIVANKFDSRDELKANLDTVWSVELLRGLALAFLMWASAYPMAWFYGQDQLRLVIPVLGLITLLGALQNIGLVLLRKEISFARIFWYELITNVIGIAATIGLALVMRNVWALVVGMLLTSTLGTVLSYVFHSYRPRFSFEKTAVRRILNVGKLTLLIAIASYVLNMADNVMVGRVLGSNALGNYSLGFNISSAPISVLVFSLSSVLFPAYAEINLLRPEGLDRAFTKVFSVALLIIVTIAGPLFLLSDDVVQVLFGSKWTSAGTVLRILALVIPLRGFTLLVSSFFWGLNRPKDVAVNTTLEALIFLAALYPLIGAFGLAGAAWAGMIAYGFGCVSRTRTLGQIIPGVSTKLFSISLSIVAASAIGLLIVWLILRSVTSPLARLILGGLLSVTIPPLILLSIRPELKRSLVDWFS